MTEMTNGWNDSDQGLTCASGNRCHHLHSFIVSETLVPRNASLLSAWFDDTPGFLALYRKIPDYCIKLKCRIGKIPYYPY